LDTLYDDAPLLTAEDLARARHRINGRNVSRKEWKGAVEKQLGKQRVTIMLDTSVLEFFKARAGERGYQTLINQSLHQFMQGEALEDTLRRVLREEFHNTP
jgi:uncharacterized protein (DUF4415 family)